MNGEGMEDNFNCLICTEMVKNAVETLCCGQLMCQECSQDLLTKHNKCPNCRQALSVKVSALARRITSTMKVPCHFGCQQKIVSKQLNAHYRKCPSRIISCKVCEKQVRQKNLLQHMTVQHQDKLFDICVDFQLGPLVQPTMSKISSVGSSRIVQSRVKSSKGNFCQMGTTGKYYCGERNLIGKCGCCDGRCGPTNGENCDTCMEQDVKRLNLPKGYLVNTAGIVCQADEKKGKYFCGRMLAGKSACSEENPCGDCFRMTNGVRLGRYKSLI